MSTVMVKTQKFYGLLHVPSNQMMVELGKGRGYTHIDFPLEKYLEGVPPRLFLSEHGAKAARTWWLKGRTSVTMCRSSSPWDEGDFYETWNTNHAPERKLEDMKVVEIVLNIYL